MQSILDPAYYSKNTTPQVQPRVYKDCDGITHDPDYRHFPAVSTYTSSTEDDMEYSDPFSLPRSSSLPPSFPASHSNSPSPTPSPNKKTTMCHRLSKKNSNLHLVAYPVTRLGDGAHSEDEDAEDEEEGEIAQVARKHEEKQTVKRNLQAMSLSVSVGVFRARKRVKSALSR